MYVGKCKAVVQTFAVRRNHNGFLTPRRGMSGHARHVSSKRAFIGNPTCR